MAIIYNAAVKNARLQAVVNAIDAAATPGTLEIFTAGLATLLAEVPLADPCGAVANGVLTFTMPQSDPVANNAGVAAEALIKDGDGTVVVSGLTVGGIAEGTQAGKDIVLNAATIVAGQTVAINTATITHA